MKKWIGFGLLLVAVVVGSFFLYRYLKRESVISPLSLKKLTEKPLEKYTFENLRKQKVPPSQITLGKTIKTTSDYTSSLFYFRDNGKKVSGLMDIPKKPGTYPVLVLFRGFVPREQYAEGMGTLRDGEFFASHGFITLAPDFLGYGDSDPASQDSLEDRFQTYTTSLSLFSAIPTLNTVLSASSSSVLADSLKVGIWGHSNGGHIALSVLSITGKPYPTVLWNPVSSVFPYSILYFIDEYDDHGKALIQVAADFEKDYDAEKFSPPNYYKYITAPIQLHQGLSDVEVPVKWSDTLNEDLKKQGTSVEYFTYPGENHNFGNGSWTIAIDRSLQFFQKELVK